MKKDWLFAVDNCICDVRTVGVLIRDGKILVQRDCNGNGNEFALPGGHIRIGETLEDGLIREYREETGAEISCVKLLWSEECLWEWNGRAAHSIAFYYLIDDHAAIPDTGEFVPHKDSGDVVMGWMPVEDIQNVVIYPAFIKTEIDRLDGPMKHFVTRGDSIG